MENKKGIKELEYLYFDCQKNEGGLTIHFKFEKDFDFVENGTELQNLANEIWSPLLELFITLIGCQESDIMPSRWINRKVYNERNFNIENWNDFPWKSFSGMVHFRKWLNNRSIDKGFIDLYLNFSTDPYSYECDGEIALYNNQSVIYKLIELKPKLQELLSSLAKIAINDNTLFVNITDPMWVEECMPVFGGNAYWIKGIIA